MTPKQEAAMVFREIKVGEYVLRFWPSDNGWMCGITPEMMQALTEPKEKYQYGTPLLDAMTGKTEQPAHVAAVNTSSERVDKTAENVHEQPASKPCEWQREDDIHMPDTWRSECGVLWTFTDGGPVENDMKHCCGCGAKLKEKNA